MSVKLLSETPAGAIAIHPISATEWEGWAAGQSEAVANWARRNRFAAEPGSQLLLPAADGGLAAVLVGVDAAPDLWALAGLPATLPDGDYRLARDYPAAVATRLATGWLLGGYRYTRYKAPKSEPAAALAVPGAELAEAREVAAAVALARDLINTPAEHMGPAELAAAAEALAAEFGAECRVLVGDELLAANYPAVHAVGRAAARAPRLIDLRWGAATAPKLTLVGKGVCFDSGGLDLKPAAGMRLMKTDMGGAATVLALARLVMARQLPVRLRVLVPAVENAVAGNANRPGDVLATRKGLTVEIGNTDAEGRLILCDALAEADAERPELLIDCATLTGAARVALGPDLPALFSPDDALAENLLRHGVAEADPLWRLPLWAGYAKWLDSPIADLNNVAESSGAGVGGAIVGALYLQRFVTATPAWAHIDMGVWSDADRPGRPKGAHAMALRALDALLVERFGG